MQRKPGFPAVNCSIKLPEPVASMEPALEEESDQRSQQFQMLNNFGHSQWGFSNWSWRVSRQDVDFVDVSNGKYCAGVAAFVAVTVKSLDIHRENVGFATCIANNKGSALHRARKCSVTNALRETLLSFGGNVATELMELLKSHRTDYTDPVIPEDKNQIDKSSIKNLKKEISGTSTVHNGITNVNIPHNPSAPHITSNAPSSATTPIRPHMPPKTPLPPPMAKALPMPASLPPAPVRPPVPPAPPVPVPPVPRAPAPRPNPNVSFVLQPVMPPLYAPPPRIPPPQMYPNYYEYTGPWHFTYEPYDRHGNVNLNFNIPPKNLVVNSRAGDCKSACRQGPSVEGEPIQYGQTNQGCWIKPTIFYDGFWTEQKVKKWVTEQVEKQFPDDVSQTAASPSSSHSQEPPPKS